MKKRFPVSRKPFVSPSLAEWRALATSQHIIAREENRLAEHLQRAPGQRLLLLGGWFPSYALGERWRRAARLSSSVDTAITLTTPQLDMPLELERERKRDHQQGQADDKVQADRRSGVILDGICVPEQLPLREDDLDVIVAPHLAEHCNDLSASVREAARALEGGGWLMLTGFMPASPLAALVARQPGFGWVRRRVGPSALRVLFAEEGFKVMLHECWSLGPECSEKRWRWMPDFLQRLFQGKSRSYLIIAKKIVIPLTPEVSDWLKPVRRAPRSVVATSRASTVHSEPTAKFPLEGGYINNG